MAQETTYSRFACIGTGFSGIALGCTLQRWYGITDIRFFDRESELGGTWWVNQYPGAACDVPSAFYSFSFEPNADWSRVLPLQQELHKYLRRVAQKYDLVGKMSFGTNVERCEWLEEKARWRMTVLDYASQTRSFHECQFLFSGVGQFGVPRPLDVPGTETFRGPIVHAARWQADLDLDGKEVVLFGNGCSGAQIVPSIVGRTRHLTQIVRAKHWIFPPVDRINSARLRWQLKYIPGAQILHRLMIFLVIEDTFRGYYMTRSGQRFRDGARREAEAYMRETAPAKYHDLLVPDFEVYCKRRIFDSGYLEALHADNLTLTDEAAAEVLPEGVRMRSGRIVPADVIVLANGYVSNELLGDVDIIGRGGKTLQEHWAKEFGGPEAYNSCVVNGFPNFFMLFGPNSVTGHSSAVQTVENTVNYALRVLKPLLDGQGTIANIKFEAEKREAREVQRDLRKLVFFSGCSSWYVRKNEADGTSWNGTTYPYPQPWYWYRCLFPRWNDWEFSGQMTKKPSSWLSAWRLLLVAALPASVVASVLAARKSASLAMLVVLLRRAMARLPKRQAGKSQ